MLPDFLVWPQLGAFFQLNSRFMHRVHDTPGSLEVAYSGKQKRAPGVLQIKFLFCRRCKRKSMPCHLCKGVGGRLIPIISGALQSCGETVA